MARPGLGTNRKFLRLTRALGSKVLARGVLETLWEPCYESGDAYLGTSDDIEDLCEWKGERGALTRALVDAGAPKGAGFIEPYTDVRGTTEPHYQVHDLLQNAPEYVASRRTRHQERNIPKTCVRCGGTFYAADVGAKYCVTACRVADWRERQRAVTANVTANGHATFCNGTPVPVPVPVPVPEHDPVRVRVRDDHDHETPAASSAAAVGDVQELGVEDPPVARLHQRPPKKRGPDPSPDDSPIVLTFPVTGVGGPTWLLREGQLTRWTVLYPTLDVLSEARQALAYVEASPSRRKTAGGMTKFLVAWFNRSVDSPRGRSPTLITGSLKTAGNRAAINEFLQKRGINGLD